MIWTLTGERCKSLMKKSGKNLTVMPEPSAKSISEAKRTYGTIQTHPMSGTFSSSASPVVSAAAAFGFSSAPCSSAGGMVEDGAASDAAGAPFERSASASASSPSVASFLYKSIGINIGSSIARPTRTTSRKFSLLHTSPLTRKRVIEIIGPSAEATRLIWFSLVK